MQHKGLDTKIEVAHDILTDKYLSLQVESLHFASTIDKYILALDCFWTGSVVVFAYYKIEIYRC